MRCPNSIALAATLALLAPFLALSSAQTSAPPPSPAAHPAVTSWTNWRGPFYNGTSNATALPDKISPDSNLLWSTPLPGPSGATPIIAGGHIYLPASDPATKKLRALCLDAATGKIEWNHEVADIPPANFRNTYASPSAVADDQGACFLFGSGDIISCDTAGTTRWSRKLSAEFGRIGNDWVYSSSPLLLNDTLYIQALQRHGDSFLIALNPKDGKTKWRQNRPTTAIEESRDAYTTPLPLFLKDSTQILLLGGDCLTAHEPETGKELWRFGGFNPQQRNNWRIIPSAVADADRAYISVARGVSTIAIKIGGAEGGGDVTASHKAWSLDNTGSDSPTSALSNGLLYILDDRKTLHAVDAAAGTEKTSLRLAGDATFYASPTIADGKIFCLSDSSEVVILSVDPLKIISRTTLTDKGPARSSISVIDGKLFVRTATKLWCFTK